MKKLCLLLLILISNVVYGETIDLSCRENRVSNGKLIHVDYNLTIVKTSTGKPRIFFDDKEQGGTFDYGVTKITDFILTNSEINFNQELDSFRKEYPNGVVIESGYSKTNYKISRTTGKLTVYSVGYGGMKSLVGGGTGSSLDEGMCEKRKLKKF
jgi:hypothetical protein